MTEDVDGPAPEVEPGFFTRMMAKQAKLERSHRVRELALALHRRGRLSRKRAEEIAATQPSENPAWPALAFEGDDIADELLAGLPPSGPGGPKKPVSRDILARCHNKPKGSKMAAHLGAIAQETGHSVRALQRAMAESRRPSPK